MSGAGGYTALLCFWGTSPRLHSSDGGSHRAPASSLSDLEPQGPHRQRVPNLAPKDGRRGESEEAGGPSVEHIGSPGSIDTPSGAPGRQGWEVELRSCSSRRNSRDRKCPPRPPRGHPEGKRPRENGVPLLTCSSAGLRPGVLTGACGTPAQRPRFSGRGRSGRPEHSAWRLDMSG